MSRDAPAAGRSGRSRSTLIDATIAIAVVAILCVPVVFFLVMIFAYLIYPFAFMIVWGYYADTPNGSPQRSWRNATGRLAAVTWFLVLGNWILMPPFLDPCIGFLLAGRPPRLLEKVCLCLLLLPGALVGVLATRAISRLLRWREFLGLSLGE